MKTFSALLGILAALACHASDPDPRIAKEIARLETTLQSIQPADLPEQARDLIGVHRTALERAKRAKTAEYQLYRLREPFTGIEILAFLAKEKQARASVDAFAKLWNREKPRFDAKTSQPRGTMLQRALIEDATTRAERLFNASLPYAKASEPWSGVYYLGEAEGNLRFREFIRSIATDSKEKSPARANVAAMVDELEKSTVTFFANDVTNQNVVAVSARLKEARELLDANRIDGAALLAVEARAALSRRGGPKGTYKTKNADRADSIVAALQSWSSDEEAPMSDALRNEVIPFFAALYDAQPTHTAIKPARVTVTLVRWPYT